MRNDPGAAPPRQRLGRTVLAAGALLWGLIGPVPLRADALDQAPRITNIRVRNVGAGPLDEDFVRMHISVQAGETLDQARLFQDVRALLDTRRFSQVEADALPVDDGLELVVSVRNRLRLAEPVRIAGPQHLRASKLRNLLDLNVGDRVDDAVVGARVQAALGGASISKVIVVKGRMVNIVAK